MSGLQMVIEHRPKTTKANIFLSAVGKSFRRIRSMNYYAYTPHSTGSENETCKLLSPRGEGRHTCAERSRTWHSLRGTPHLQEKTTHQ